MEKPKADRESFPASAVGPKKPRGLGPSVSFHSSVEYLLEKVKEAPNTYEVISNIAAIVVLIVASMESGSNQTIEMYRKWLGPLADILKNRCTLIDKIQAFSSLVHGRPLDPGTEPYQSFNDIIWLRNLLVHDKPEFEPWFYSDEEIAETRHYKRFAARWKVVGGGRPLRDSKTLEGSPWKEARVSALQSILTFDCAKWAIRLQQVQNTIFIAGVNRWKYDRSNERLFVPDMPKGFDMGLAERQAHEKW